MAEYQVARESQKSPDIQYYVEEPWPNDKDEYRLEEIIGKGSTGTVYKSLYNKQKQICAIKRINLEKCDLAQLGRQIEILKACRHPNIINCYASFYVEQEVWIVMRLFDRGSLRQIMDRQILSMGGRYSIKKGLLNEHIIATILKEILSALDYIHDSEYIHGDVKSANILISSEGDIQLADFGPSVWIASEERTKQCMMRGTPCYLAPEIAIFDMDDLDRDIYTINVDIWSVGIIALEMVTGYPPYHNKPVNMILKWIQENDPPDLGLYKSGDYHEYSKKYHHFVSSCLKRSARHRWSTKKLINHPFIINNARNGEYLINALFRAFPYVVLPGDEQSSKKRLPPITADNENLGDTSSNVIWDYNVEIEDEQQINRISKTITYEPGIIEPSAEIAMSVSIIQSAERIAGSGKIIMSADLQCTCKYSVEQQVFQLVQEQKLEPKYIVIVAAKLWKVISAAQHQDLEGKYFAFVIDKCKDFVTILDICISVWCYITDHRIKH